MKPILILLLLATAASADTYYVRYFVDDGSVQQYATDFPSDSYRISADGKTFTGMPDPLRSQKVFMSALDAAPSLGRTNIVQFPDAIILNALDLSYSIRRTEEWYALTNSISAYAPLRDAAAAEIALVSDSQTKKALNALKAVYNQLQDEIQKTRKLIGKNMQVEP